MHMISFTCLRFHFCGRLTARKTSTDKVLSATVANQQIGKLNPLKETNMGVAQA